jgi:hypothetical protein
MTVLNDLAVVVEVFSDDGNHFARPAQALFVGCDLRLQSGH